MSDPKTPPRQEFERKFLVIQPELPAEDWPHAIKIAQAYLHVEGPVVRVRTYGDISAMLEIKGKDSFESSAMRMDIDEARWLMANERKGEIIRKDRFPFKGPAGLAWEVDVYKDGNAPLVVAEIETPTKDFILDPKDFPKWIGPEITSDKRFKNKQLAINPFSTWPAADIAATKRLMGI